MLGLREPNRDRGNGRTRLREDKRHDFDYATGQPICPQPGRRASRKSAKGHELHHTANIARDTSEGTNNWQRWANVEAYEAATTSYQPRCCQQTFPCTAIFHFSFAYIASVEHQIGR